MKISKQLLKEIIIEEYRGLLREWEKVINDSITHEYRRLYAAMPRNEENIMINGEKMPFTYHMLTLLQILRDFKAQPSRQKLENSLAIISGLRKNQNTPDPKHSKYRKHIVLAADLLFKWAKENEPRRVVLPGALNEFSIEITQAIKALGVDVLSLSGIPRRPDPPELSATTMPIAVSE
jgi:hypothetical protein